MRNPATRPRAGLERLTLREASATKRPHNFDETDLYRQEIEPAYS
jgi:hypothetical protein